MRFSGEGAIPVRRGLGRISGAARAGHCSPLINTTTSAARAMKAHRLAAAAISGIPPAVTIDVLDDSRY